MRVDQNESNNEIHPFLYPHCFQYCPPWHPTSLPFSAQKMGGLGGHSIIWFGGLPWHFLFSRRPFLGGRPVTWSARTAPITAFERVCWLASNLAPLVQKRILPVTCNTSTPSLLSGEEWVYWNSNRLLWLPSNHRSNVIVTTQARLLGLLSAVVSLRGIWECVGHEKALIRVDTYRSYTKGYRKLQS